jgi:hypothetical protein
MKQFIRPTALLALSVIVGCGGSKDTQTAQNTPTTGGKAAAVPNQPLVVDGVGTEPAQAVAVFLDSLRRGDETAANGVLTTRAREELQKTAYQIQPLGTPDGKYEIGRVGYPYEEKNVALVECKWTEPMPAGQAPLVMDIVCEVHQEAEGWRISGLGVTMADTEETLVLDFEDAASLQETLEGSAQPQQTANTQTLPSSEFQPNMQAQPSTEPAQLAFPPINNAPLQR